MSLPSLGGLLRSLLGRPRPAPALPAQAPPPRPPGHPDNPLTENLLARRRLGALLASLAQGDSAEAVGDISSITAWRPGLASEGDPADHLEGLQAAARLLPDNLTLRLALAEALDRTGQADAARDLAISVIRSCRPTSLPAREGVDVGELYDVGLAGMFFHSVDLGSDFIEGAPKSALITAREMLQAHWPDLTGKTVLDIGSFNGWYAFESERRGAASVTANDYYSWMVDFPKVWKWVADQHRLGMAADPYTAPYPINDPAGLPGRVVFDRTRKIMGSSVSPVFGPIETVDVPPHDIVLLLGVLYHSEDPLGLLRRAFDLTREVLIIETLSFEYPDNLDAPIWHFYAPGDISRDQTTVWAPSSLGLRDALLKVGFTRVELLYGWDGSGYHCDWRTLEARLWVHAFR